VFTLFFAEVWKPLCKELKQNGNSLVAVTENLVDPVWDGRPDPPSSNIMVLPQRYTGK
jgi:Xaa-Pro aminopeptidase